ncbi:hypothetical protein PHBOTO_006061 [Pseudozyma hubeiensis]|nr:hypothetical protein PHBOTO_006061 [Pseudozyma hubeiensis]
MTSFQPTYSIFTHSVGYHTSNHTLLSKLDSIATVGIQQVEIFTDDLWVFAQSEEFSNILKVESCQGRGELLTPPDSPLSKPALLKGKEEKCYSSTGECTAEERRREVEAAEYIRKYCEERGMRVSCLQPLRDVEGWVGETERVEAMERVRGRFEVMRALGTNLLLICSSNTPAPRTTGDANTIVRDFLEISDLALQFTQSTGWPIKVGYEALSWGAHIDLWSQAWNIVRTVNRPNIGLIFDSFNTLAREFADPCSTSGIQEPISSTLSALERSIDKISQVPGDKIFLLQIGDARKMPSPLEPSPREGEPRPSRMIWSRSSRLYPCEQSRGGFMPVEAFVRKVVQAGYRGVWSIEVFNSELEQEGVEVERSAARRAREGLDRLVEVVFK